MPARPPGGTDTAPEVRTTEPRADTRILVDVDGNGTTDLKITVQGVQGLTEAASIV